MIDSHDDVFVCPVLLDSKAASPWYALIILTVTVTLTGFAAPWLRLRSGSVWRVVLAVQSLFNQPTADTGVQFGFGFVLSGSVIAYIFWRLRHRITRISGQRHTTRPRCLRSTCVSPDYRIPCLLFPSGATKRGTCRGRGLQKCVNVRGPFSPKGSPVV